jgi:hypothetical protein
MKFLSPDLLEQFANLLRRLVADPVEASVEAAVPDEARTASVISPASWIVTLKPRSTGTNGVASRVLAGLPHKRGTD